MQKGSICAIVQPNPEGLWRLYYPKDEKPCCQWRQRRVRERVLDTEVQEEWKHRLREWIRPILLLFFEYNNKALGWNILKLYRGTLCLFESSWLCWLWTPLKILLVLCFITQFFQLLHKTCRAWNRVGLKHANMLISLSFIFNIWLGFLSFNWSGHEQRCPVYFTSLFNIHLMNTTKIGKLLWAHTHDDLP